MIDVARMAGVSHQTVSRVLNNPEKVREKTRRAVEDAIAKTGYRRNENARVLKSGVPSTLGILVPSASQYGPTEILWSIERAAADAGYSTKLSLLSGRSESAVNEAIDRLLANDVALIFICAAESWVEPAVRVSVDLPIIDIGCTESSIPGVSTVDIDQPEGVRAMMRHLRDEGATRIDHIAGPEGWYSADARLTGWREAQADFALIAGHLYRGDWSEESGYRAGNLIAQDLPSAVFAGNDQMALGLIRALHEHGIRVPEDVRVAGYDNIAVGEYTIPSLTTVDQDFEELGRIAVRQAVAVLNGEGSHSVLTHPRLVIRESSTRRAVDAGE
ncbi:LacI family transcriptional regulator [Bifidobacterium simiarum]|uniref:LacI family transcriptional regulator n=2 Tax=Bifidobacterium simiarum TaxID=2045441 RepID=A0A2M9HGG5_9BIFI|nr:LacI family transcriptional regulator [Bifidobacterium simiarum]